MPSETPQEYRHRASECERLARSAVNVEVRAVLRYMAGRWWEFAEEAQARLEPITAGTSGSLLK